MSWAGRKGEVSEEYDLAMREIMSGVGSKVVSCMSKGSKMYFWRNWSKGILEATSRQAAAMSSGGLA